MKTSDASSKPVQQQQSSSQPTTQHKTKTSQKEFKEVLQESKTKQPLTGKGKNFSPLAKKTLKSGEEKPEVGIKGSHQKADGETKLHARVEAREEEDSSGQLGQRHSKSELPDNVNLGNLQNQGQIGISKVESGKAIAETRGAGLNISEIESIVKQVQVGINEKGLPEMNFELKTQNLGDISLKVNSDNEKISIQFITQDVSAQDTLNQNLKELTQQLQNRGLNIGDVDVRTRDEQQREQQQKQRRESQEQDDSGFA